MHVAASSKSAARNTRTTTSAIPTRPDRPTTAFCSLLLKRRILRWLGSRRGRASKVTRLALSFYIHFMGGGGGGATNERTILISNFEVLLAEDIKVAYYMRKNFQETFGIEILGGQFLNI
ncbi:hypothetical protein C1H46_023775 [Malus baccata]|uniref:Uncharacterized protein n=1 Tax=Malus baccata TaxID=106549 RepID=A0A540LW48_MALBA|nr:hypothetical protein C1H46_023775 [Malus baccata]